MVQAEGEPFEEIADTSYRSDGSYSVANTSRNDNNDDENVKIIQGEAALFEDKKKLSEQNMWKAKIIDKYKDMVLKHHPFAVNFKVVAKCLVAMTNVFEKRVDSVYNDVFRLSNSSAYGKRCMNENAPASNVDGERQRAKSQRAVRRFARSTVVQNKNTINGKLDVVSMPDPVYSKIKSIVGETSAVNKLLLVTLETKDSLLDLNKNGKFFDKTTYQPIVFRDDDDYEDIVKEDYSVLPTAFDLNPQLTLRQTLDGYQISNAMFDEEEDDSSTLISNTTASQFNDSEYPIADLDIDFAMDFDNIENEEPIPNTNSCLTDAAIMQRDIDQTSPTGSSQSDYAYRPLSQIQNIVGPSYWKYPPRRRSQPQPEAEKRPRRQKVQQQPNFRLSARELEDEDDDEVFISTESSRAQKIRRVQTKNWINNDKKLVLSKCPIEKNYFDSNVFCPPKTGTLFADDNEEGEEIEVDVDAENDFEEIRGDNDVAGNMHDYFDFDPNLDDRGDGNIDVQLSPPETQSTQFQEDSGEIGLIYENAPDIIQSLDVKYVRRAKQVNMKRLNRATQDVINKRTNGGRGGGNASTKFSEVYKRLPKRLSKRMAQDLTPSLGFLSILHLCNESSNTENQMGLSQSHEEREENDFSINLVNSNK